MIELVVEAIIALIRLIGILVFQGAIFQPIYWIGWCILKTITFGKVPKKIQGDYHWSEFLCWAVGLIIITSSFLGFITAVSLTYHTKRN